MGRHVPAKHPPLLALDHPSPSYFLFIGKSSTKVVQAPEGLAFLLAFLMTVIFIWNLLSNDGTSCASETPPASRSRPPIPELLLVHREVVNKGRAGTGGLGVLVGVLDDRDFHLESPEQRWDVMCQRNTPRFSLSTTHPRATSCSSGSRQQRSCRHRRAWRSCWRS